MKNDVEDRIVCLDYMKNKLIENVKLMDGSDTMFLRRIYISVDDYMRDRRNRQKK